MTSRRDPSASGSERSALPLVRAIALAGVALLAAAAARAAPDAPDRGKETFEQICASCHGVDGRGGPGAQKLQVKMPDFTDCSFATREPDADWIAVAHAGGAARGFSPLMPAWGGLGPETLQLAIAHIRTFCRERDWPAGELNLPRPQVTEKAYPEDEAVLTFDGNAEHETSAEVTLQYEKRFGRRAQIELVLPLAVEEQAGGRNETGIGDIELAGKYVLWHSRERGGIVSAGAAVTVPTGDRDRGLGGGTTVLEPQLLFGQVLPRDFFLHGQLLAELPTRGSRGDDEMQLRLALGRSWFAGGGYGREWAPMLELIATHAFARGEPDVELDVVPQLQVALSRRQHVRASLGASIPATQTHERPVRALLYLLWDWYDGGLTEGW